MSAKFILLCSFVGVLGFAAMTVLDAPDTSAMTLERGLGPEVETSQL